MHRLICLVLPFAVVLLLVAACDPRSEEESTSSSESTQEMSTEEILHRVVEAGNAVHSVQIESTDVSSGIAFLGQEAQPEETQRLEIRVGDDYYAKYTGAFGLILPGNVYCEEDPSACEEFQTFCQQNVAECEQLRGWTNESLYYHGNIYFRGKGGAWTDEPESDCINTTTNLSCGAWVETVGLTEFEVVPASCPALAALYSQHTSLVSGLYQLDFGALSNILRLDDEALGGRELMHLKADYSFAFLSFDVPDDVKRAYEDCGIPVPTIPPMPEMELFNEFIPDRSSGQVELWIGADDFCVYRLVMNTHDYRGDRLLQSSTLDARFSRFNQAELPGPLPR